MKIGGLVHARMTSERLPGKGLAEIHGRPALGHLFDRLTATRYLSINDVVLCIPDGKGNEPLAEFATAEGAKVYRGSEFDLIARFSGAVAAHSFDAVIQADGDDICIDPIHADLAMETLLADESIDIVLSRGLPLGAATKAIRTRAIEQVQDHYVPGDNSTGAFLYFTETELCAVHTIWPISPDYAHERARLTLDYKEDLEFFCALFEALQLRGVPRPFPLPEIVRTLRERPELVGINAFLSDAYWDRSDEIITAERLLYRTENGVREVELQMGGSQWFSPDRGAGDGGKRQVGGPRQ